MVKDSAAAVDSFRTIASLMVTSPAFRQLGSDVILLSRDILADSAEVVADQASAVSIARDSSAAFVAHTILTGRRRHSTF
jgi:hypothetical protein